MLDTFDGHEQHVGSRHRLTDRLGIVAIVLAALTTLRNALRRHQSHRMTEQRKAPRSSTPCSENTLFAKSMPQRDGALIDEFRLQLRDIVVFDGICNLCTRSVKFILKHEAEHRILFAPLQSPAGARLLSDHGFDPNNASTFIFISEGALYTKSAAAIRIASHFKGVWKLARLLRLIPRPLRDWGYDMVARSRYQWFGKSDSCMVPTPDLESRFLYDESMQPSARRSPQPLGRRR